MSVKMDNKLYEAAHEALEALEQLHGGCTDSDDGTVEAITVWCPEVIERLRAALDAGQAQPLTDEQITKGWRETWVAVPSSATAFRDGVRFAERAHGIRSET